MLAAFIGWPDAAQVSTGAVAYFIKKLQAKKLAELKSDDYYDFATIRPVISVEDGIMTPMHMPMNTFYYWKDEEGGNDLILLTGIEPQMRWQSYVENIADLAGFYNVNRIYAAGGLYDRIPHTREIRISGLVNDESLLPVLQQHNIEPISYQGPSSIHGLLLTVCSTRRIPAVSLWGHVPFYIRSESNPIVCLEIVKRLSSLLDMQVPLMELTRSSDHLTDVLGKLLTENEQMRNFLTALEQQYDQGGSALGEEFAGSEQVIHDIEEFLRNQRTDL
jgi:proteasome assembly chaperone (PAC2) family protein